MSDTNKFAPRVFEPSIYAVVLSDEENTPRKLWLGIAYMLEGALEGARESAKEDFPEEKDRVDFWRPLMYHTLRLDSFPDMIKEVVKSGFGEENKTIDDFEEPKELKIITIQKEDKKKEFRGKATRGKKTVKKNDLMKKILTAENKMEMLIKNKKQFTKSEYNYLLDKITPDGRIERKK